jgi:hypothetical protein
VAKKATRKTRQLKPSSQRRTNIRAEIKPWLDRLIQLYNETDPVHGTFSEVDKLEKARTAIELWWYVYAELMLWAQSQLAGYEFCKANPATVTNFEKALGVELTADSHLIEYVGLQYSMNWVNYEDELANFVSTELERKRAGLGTAGLRSLIRELLVSRSANSSSWRFPLQSALFALNYGHVEPLLEPSPTRRQGNPIELLNWKTKALQKVYFLVGKGSKKYRALQTVADGIGQSTETLRDWEKIVSMDEDLRMSLVAALLAGEHESELDSKHPSELRKTLAREYHRNMSDIERAHYELDRIRNTSLDDIRNGIRAGRTLDAGAGKRDSNTAKRGA